MRIIAGKYRAKILKSPKSGVVRPTSDRAREALFNILNSKLNGEWDNCKFLDVFAGTGAVGLEALSRGAEKVGFIDMHTENLLQNVKLFPQEQKKITICKAWAENLPVAGEGYNLVFLDAPYAKNLSEPALDQLLQKKWLEQDALVVVETQKDENFVPSSAFEIIDERVYGPAKFHFLRLENKF